MGGDALRLHSPTPYHGVDPLLPTHWTTTWGRRAGTEMRLETGIIKPRLSQIILRYGDAW
jgi:hypothetical protein